MCFAVTFCLLLGAAPLQSECCYHDDPACDPGAVCCLDGCADPLNCTYTQSGCSGSYGQNHNCTWNDVNEYCYVPVVPVVVEAPKLDSA